MLCSCCYRILTQKFTWCRFSLLVRCCIGGCIDKGYVIAFIATRISVTFKGYDIGVAHGSVAICVLKEFHIIVECMTRRNKAFNFRDMCLQRPNGVRGSDEEGVDAP